VASAQERTTRVEPDKVGGVELEPHFTFGAGNVYAATGIGGGLRVGIPIADGYVGRFPDSWALSLGGDIVHYDNCYFGRYCAANYLFAPVAAQWNIALAPRASLFAEGGVFVYRGWFDACTVADGPGCSAPSDFGVLPTVAIGGRYRVGEHTALALRVGYPTITFGVSFL
jgi:hypothetical protein